MSQPNLRTRPCGYPRMEACIQANTHLFHLHPVEGRLSIVPPRLPSQRTTIPRSTSLIRSSAPLGPYSRNISGALWRPWGGGAVSYDRGTPCMRAQFCAVRVQGLWIRAQGSGFRISRPSVFVSSLCFSTAERCPPKQVSSAKRLKAKVEPLLT